MNTRLAEFREGSYASAIVDFTDLEKGLNDIEPGKPFYFALNTDSGSKVFFIEMTATKAEGQTNKGYIKFMRDYTKYANNDMYTSEDFHIRSFASDVCTQEEIDSLGSNLTVSAAYKSLMADYVMNFLDAVQVISKMPY